MIFIVLLAAEISIKKLNQIKGLRSITQAKKGKKRKNYLIAKEVIAILIPPNQVININTLPF